jgi:hypothetical protein
MTSAATPRSARRARTITSVRTAGRTSPAGHQQLCYNEVPTKYNWHYFKMGFDLRTMSFTSLQCNDRVFDVSSLEPMRMPAWPNLNCLFNVCWTVESDSHKRTFVYLDSVLVSGDWEDA